MPKRPEKFLFPLCDSEKIRHRAECAKFSSGKCVVCNLPSACTICYQCQNKGFVNKSNTNIPLLGVETNSEDILLHTIFINGEIPEIRLKYFLVSLKKTKRNGIIWTDSKYTEKLKFEISKHRLQQHCDVVSVEQLYLDYIRDNTTSYLGKKIKYSLINIIKKETSSYFNRIAYATDILRIIILQLYGGLYLDSNIRCITRVNLFSGQLSICSKAGVMSIYRGSDGHKADDVAADSHSLYSLQQYKPNI